MKKVEGYSLQKPTKKTKSRKSSADFTDYAHNSRERRHLAGVLEIGTINPPAAASSIPVHANQRTLRKCSGQGSRHFDNPMASYMPDDAVFKTRRAGQKSSGSGNQLP
jgi:hypothetical protein